MAKFDTLIPFILHYEVGVAVKHLSLPLEQLFDIAKRQGYANVPGDRGGPTMCGVTIGTYTSYRRSKGIASTSVNDLNAMSYSEWRDIYKSMFWDRCKADDITSQPVANMIVDWTWHSGADGIKIPQSILGVSADGIVGPKSINAINAANPEALFNALKQARVKFVENIALKRPSQNRFLKGWKRRINSITYNGFNYG